MPRLKPDPRLIAPESQEQKALADCEKWFARLSRAFRALDKSRRRLASAGRRIVKHKQDAEAPRPV